MLFQHPRYCASTEVAQLLYIPPGRSEMYSSGGPRRLMRTISTMCCLNVNLAFLNGFSVLLTSFIIVVVVVLLMLIFLLQSFYFYLFFSLNFIVRILYMLLLCSLICLFLYFMALSYMPPLGINLITHTHVSCV